MSRREEHDEKVLKYIEEIRSLIVSLLFNSKEFQDLKLEMKKEGYEIEEGIFAFFTKNIQGIAERPQTDLVDSLKYSLDDEDQVLLKEWGISMM
ncbi:hypothetical protein ACFLQ1_00365 [Candidatus Auribacterota bacterium]